MYLHLGNNVVVPDNEIIGVFDLDITSQSVRTREFLSRAEKSGCVSAVGDDLPKSFVICGDSSRQRVYLSQLMSATLLKRSEGIGIE